MSRSYKKTPVIKDNGKGKKWQKNQANKRVRRLKVNEDGIIISDGNSYQKIYEPWMICDYIQRCSKEQAIKDYNEQCTPSYYSIGMWSTKERCELYAKEFKEEYPTLKDYLNKHWEKYYKRK